MTSSTTDTSTSKEADTMTTISSGTGASRRERWAWYLYDVGNSAYAAVVLLAVYSAYFKGTVVGGAEGSRLWGIAVGIAMFVVAVTSPVLGTLADFSGAKKRLLFFYTALTITFCALLFFIQRGDWLTGMLFFILAEIGYRSAQVFYNAFLPEIAEPDEIGRISGNGWAIGSFGGILCLLIVLVPIVLTGSNPVVVRLSLVFTALFFAVFSLPILAATLRTIRKFKEFVKFIVAFLIYNDGILMVLNFAAILGAVLYGMEQQELIIFMVIVQVTSIAGAYLFGLIADDFGGKRSLIVSLLLMIVPVIWLYFSYSHLAFYVIGGLAGFALTGVQSVSRTVVGMFSPPGKSAEFYGFFAVTGRTSSFVGPTIFGIVAAEASKWYQTARQMTPLAAEQAGHRLALFTVVAFLAAGLVLLLLVNEEEGRIAADL
jgi:UMF1 family MFS transporter